MADANTAQADELAEVKAAGESTWHVAHHLRRTGGSAAMDHRLAFALAEWLRDTYLQHEPGDGECTWDGERWPCTDVKRAHDVAQVVNEMWPRLAVEGGVRP